ncbi:MAG: NAD(P)-binding domain-containing protein [Eubacterium sp.]|nr:NAD(P)-binding domain-containing protein [Eubacterium sp.]
MKLKKFIVPFMDDKRMIYAKDYLEKQGFEYTDNSETADFVVLPVPAKKDMFFGLKDKIVFHGMGDYKNGFDYMQYESYVLKNAFLTSEGAVTLLEENTSYSLYRAKVLIIGYGRIGKSLHSILKGYGADITVCSRSKASKDEAIFNGAKHINFEQLKADNQADIIINTVPHMVLTKAELSAVKKDSVILDLASFPGGVDTLVADSMGLRVLNGRRMPSRYTEKTAGYLIGEAVSDIIEEELT